jgi:hypothetical protein
VNYVRVHDDIGWTFSNEDAAYLNINAHDHRKFLNEFFTGRFPGSFARGLTFQENLLTGDTRISGTTASLSGLEKALKEETNHEVDLAVQRILLLYGIILTTNGIPLIYLGDEIGYFNDYSYLLDPKKAEDSRWVHRPKIDWEKMDRRKDPSTIEGRIFLNLKQLIALRTENNAFSGTELKVIGTGSDHVLGYSRSNEDQRVLVFANFSEHEQIISKDLLNVQSSGKEMKNLIEGEIIIGKDYHLKPYQLLCLSIDHSD